MLRRVPAKEGQPAENEDAHNDSKRFGCFMFAFHFAYAPLGWRWLARIVRVVSVLVVVVVVVVCLAWKQVNFVFIVLLLWKFHLWQFVVVVVVWSGATVVVVVIQVNCWACEWFVFITRWQFVGWVVQFGGCNHGVSCLGRRSRVLTTTC